MHPARAAAAAGAAAFLSCFLPTIHGFHLPSVVRKTRSGVSARGLSHSGGDSGRRCDLQTRSRINHGLGRRVVGRRGRSVLCVDVNEDSDSTVPATSSEPDLDGEGGDDDMAMAKAFEALAAKQALKEKEKSGPTREERARERVMERAREKRKREREKMQQEKAKAWMEETMGMEMVVLEEEDEGAGEHQWAMAASKGDWREYRARRRAGSEEAWQEQLKRNKNELQLKDIPTWAHEIDGPEPGCVLLANPELFTESQPYFRRCVLWLVDHNELGSAGFILNLPTQLKMKQVSTQQDPEFSENMLYFGGDVGEDTVQIIHTHPQQIVNSTEVIPGIGYGGSIDAMKKLVASGEAEADDFRFFLRPCMWGPGQLEKEIDSGVWYCCATSASLISKHCIQLPTPLWKETLTLMGGKYQKIAEEVDKKPIQAPGSERDGEGDEEK